MYRSIEKELHDWKQKSQHLPLLMRGARQVGKSFVIEDFGKKYFKNSVTINFDFNPEYAEAFNDMKPENIINMLSLMSGQSIIPKETLLFLDEIQECPIAIKALRYFKEKMPELHVIGAGSLLDFTLNDANFRMPVGRIQFIHLKPLSFKEFLLANKKEQLVEFISQVTIEKGIPEAIHLQLLKLLRTYMVLGGMPSILQNFIDNEQINECQNLQTVLLNNYRRDFGKYAKIADHKYLQQLFVKAPYLVAQHFKYVNVDPDMRARDIKRAFEILNLAGLINPIYATAAAGLPLNAQINEKKFKMIFLDIGLMNRATKHDATILLQENILLINQGALAEQLVGQELLAYADPLDETELFFWSRESKGSTAEVDYIINSGKTIIPIEVKAGKIGHLKSLRLFMKEKNIKLGLRYSQLPLSYIDNILSIPLYMISETGRLVETFLN